MNKCIWCDALTTSDKCQANTTVKIADREHIFPESVGGIKTLPIGYVCKECNGRLGREIDGHLKSENFMMMNQYQVSSTILGKPVGKVRGKADRIRKNEEINNLQGYSNGGSIKRCENTNSVTLKNMPNGSQGDISYNEKFSKAIHKCVVNILLNDKGYAYTKEHYSQLIDFVSNKKNINFSFWSYAVCYSDLFSYRHFEPFCLQLVEEGEICIAAVIVFPAGIFIVGSQPKAITPELLAYIGKNISSTRKIPYEVLEPYKTEFTFGERKLFGDQVKFVFIKKELKGEKNPEGGFYLLTTCQTCGQTNPTGIMLLKDDILEGDQSVQTGGVQNSWNKYSIDDLQRKGYAVDKWDQDALNKHIDTQAICYPKENDVKKRKIENCKCSCINCHSEIVYSAKDCYI